MIDGQHRFNVMRELHETYLHEFNVFVQVIEVNSLQSMRDNYEIINKNTPLPTMTYELVDRNKHIIQETMDYFMKKFKTNWSSSVRARRPNMYPNYFQESCMFIFDKLKTIIKDEFKLINLIEDFNENLSNWSIDRFTNVSDAVYEKAKKNNCFIGLMPLAHEEDYGYMWAKLIVEYHTGEKIKNKVQSKTRRKKISKALRAKVWNDNIGADVSQAMCPICSTNWISTFNFECGHIQAHAEGGTTNADNLLPICSMCNKSMGTQRMDEFIASQFPNNLDQFEKRYSKSFALTINTI